MIRIYLDWNVVSNFKKPEFSEIRKFVAEHKDYLQFPYTPAHFKDLMKSHYPDNIFFNSDLESLEYLSEKHLIQWGKDSIEIFFAAPKVFFETEKNNEDVFSAMDFEKIVNDLDSFEFGGKFGTFMKSMLELQPLGFQVTDENREMLNKMCPNITNNSSMWDLMKDIMPFAKKLLQNRDYYKDFRKTINDNGFKLDKNSGNWEIKDVVKNIDDFLQEKKVNLTFCEYLDSCFKHKKEPVNRYEYYTTAYLILDMIGYKSDKLPKPSNNMQNIQTDGEHSFYSAYCDYFVVMDKKLRTKTQVLFNEFNIPTIVLSPEEFIDTLKPKIHIPDIHIHFLNEALSFLEKGEIVEKYDDDENSVETYAFKLPVFYFNFFNYAVSEYYPEQNGYALTFKKVFKNYSNFTFYTESERLIDRICLFFGNNNDAEFAEKKKEFVYGEKNVEFIWRFDIGLIKLEKDMDTKRPILTYCYVLPKDTK
ncbi:MAG: hypothetical protein LBI82_09835 [Dysgonamonadaceae bacterium]|jgi:hypothetical protein|nr:hypothetical protein [Dysgonamonadaceae bacterium]